MKLRTLCVLIIAITASLPAWAAKPEFTVEIATFMDTLPGGTDVSDRPAPGRMVKLTLTSPEKPLPGALAEVWLPEGLNMGRKVKLSPVAATPQPSLPFDTSTVRLKLYWGSSPTVTPGQPKTLGWKDFPESVRKSIEPNGKASEGSAAVWASDPKGLKETASAVGDYRLGSYAGTANILLEPAQEFLAPVEASTDVTLTGDKPQSISVSWKPVAGAVAYFVTAHGASSDGSLISWFSGESDDAANQAGVDRYLSGKDVDRLVRKGVLLSPQTTKVAIPAGAFADADGIMVVVTAYGRDRESGDKNVTARAVVRSTATVMHNFGIATDLQAPAGQK